MSKSTFGINTDSSGWEFVYQKEDEFDKNHRDSSAPDDTVGEGRMYARPGDPLCPVLSYKSYLERFLMWRASIPVSSKAVIAVARTE
jgi:hypothetical protein